MLTHDLIKASLPKDIELNQSISTAGEALPIGMTKK
jgi:hypothetical protein